MYNIILTVALPYIMATYLGIAQKAASIAVECGRVRRSPKSGLASSVGALNNALTSAELAWTEMVRIANDFDFEAVDRNSHEMLTLKTLVGKACIETVTRAMEVVGGQGYFRSFGLEKLFRDVQGARYHPLPETEQHEFCGDFLLKSSV